MASVTCLVSKGFLNEARAPIRKAMAQSPSVPQAVTTMAGREERRGHGKVSVAFDENVPKGDRRYSLHPGGEWGFPSGDDDG